MKLVALILAKGDSKRLPLKNLLSFKGKPTFLWNTEKCLRTMQTYVSTDHPQILALAAVAGAIPILRGPELCGDVPNIPVYQHALQFMDEDVDGIIAVHANNPTLSHNTIVSVKMLMELGHKEVMTCHPMETKTPYKEQNARIYGSVWGITKERLLFYGSPYEPHPDAFVVDDSVEIETTESWDKALSQWRLTRA